MSATQPSSTGSRPTMSIGQVLAALKNDFPDVSVSKIRFLETERLIEPERTPSGYRKFGKKDIERLRTILTLQRDSYLPLKVIREYLDALDRGLQPPVPVTGGGGGAPAQAPLAAVPAETPPAPDTVVPPAPVEDDLAAPTPDIRLTESDLADQTGLELGQVRALKEFGVICEHTDNGTTAFDGDDLEVTRVARDMLKLGLDPRHLRSLRRAAEQEAALYEQLVVPVLRNRKPEARRQALETLQELARLSRALRIAYLRQNLRGLTSRD